uniref:THAP domain-containing protein 1 n=1 Tax=Neogobius melanostomus TaxID=47308 RepID=A0A8C6S4J7_9GOBI
MSLFGVQKQRLPFQWVGGSSLHCCVPKCTCSSRYNSCLSFHCVPADNAARQLWLARIRRANFTPSRDTRVCSRHFLPRDIFITPRGKRLLKKGTVLQDSEFGNVGHRQEESAAAADPTEDSSGSEMEMKTQQNKQQKSDKHVQKTKQKKPQ